MREISYKDDEKCSLSAGKFINLLDLSGDLSTKCFLIRVLKMRQSNSCCFILRHTFPKSNYMSEGFEFIRPNFVTRPRFSVLDALLLCQHRSGLL